MLNVVMMEGSARLAAAMFSKTAKTHTITVLATHHL